MTTNALMELADRLLRYSNTCESSDDAETDIAGTFIPVTFAADFDADMLAAYQALRTAAAEGGEVVGYTSEYALRSLATDEASGVMFGTYSERYERTVPLYLHPPTDSGAGRDGERNALWCKVASERLPPWQWNMVNDRVRVIENANKQAAMAGAAGEKV